MSEIISIGRGKYLVGLDWQSFDEPLSRKDLFEMVSQSPETYVRAHWYQTGSRYALALESLTASGKQVAKHAGMLIEMMSARAPRVPCAYTMDYGNGRYGLCVIDANRMVLPGSDILVADMSLVYDALSVFAGLVGPESVNQLDVGGIAEILASAPVEKHKIAHVSLKPFSVAQFAYTGLAVITLAALGWGGYAWYSASRAPMHTIASNLPKWHPGQALQAKATEAPASADSQPHDAAAFLSACASAAVTAPASIGGLVAHTVRCAPAAGQGIRITVIYGGTSDNSSNTQDALSAAPSDPWDAQIQGNDLVLSRSSPVQSTESTDDKSEALAAAGETLRRYAATLGALAQVHQGVSSSDQQSAWTLTSTVAPWLLPDLPRALRGLHALSLSGNFTGNAQWQMELVEGKSPVSAATIPPAPTLSPTARALANLPSTRPVAIGNTK
jgi:hypothetical protein